MPEAECWLSAERSVAIIDEQGDLFEPVSNGVVSWDDMFDMGALIAGKAAGRQSPEQITLFKQNSDQGVGYMALAKLLHDKASAQGIGTEI